MTSLPSGDVSTFCSTLPVEICRAQLWLPTSTLSLIHIYGFNAVMDYIPGFVWFFGKAFFVVFLLMWLKWTFPRLRIDQILNLEWKYLVPISLSLIHI